MLNVGDRWVVKSQYTQSGSVLYIGMAFTIKWTGGGSQVAVEFDEECEFPQGHTCSGEVPSRNGFWMYEHLIQAWCVLECESNISPAWTL